MAEQNINQYVYKKYRINLESDSMDMSLTSDERDYNQEVIFSPFLIAQTYGDRLPINFNISDPLSAQDLTLTYKNYNTNNVFVSQNYYNPKNLDLTCFSSSTACDIGLTGIDNGLVTKMSGETIYFTNGLYDDSLKFDRLHFDRRLKMFQVTGYTETNYRFSGIPKTTLYEVVSKTDPTFGKYHELYGGFYQGFYKLFGYDYDIFPERMNKGWSVEMVIKPRLIDQYFPDPDETTLNEIYPDNKNTFFYFGTRAENKFYHHADGSPNCFTGYTRVTSGLTTVETCACCNTYTNNSRCIYVYPPRSVDNKHDNHLNYGCNLCGGDKDKKLTCGCNCGEQRCDTCGWECQTHICPTIFVTPTPTPTPTVEQGCYCTPTPTPSFTPTKTAENCLLPPVCTPSCTGCETCYDCLDCSTTGYTSVEDTCEKDPLYDSLSNAFSLKLYGDPKNPKICVKVLKITGDCQTSGTCITGQTYVTGYTVTEYCSPNSIYDYCIDKCTPFFDVEKWVNINVVWSRYTYLDTCDLKYRGGLDDITKREYLDSLANDTTKLITVPITNGKKEPEMVELVNLNQKWLDDKKYRMGRLRIYVNGKPFYTIENFEEIIPRALNTDKERQLGVPFNISWGGGTQGLHENLTFSSTTYPYNNYIQDPELFPENILSGTTFAGMKTNILLEQNFGGTFEGGISQFRMYVTPLSSAEVKHNFNVLKGTFDMFDYDCPDCDVFVCDVNDFTYEIETLTPTPTTTTIIPTETPTPTPTPTPTSTSVYGENLCSPPCSLGFDTYSSNTIGQLVVGSLTGGCGSITSYVIYWYDSLENIQLVSGYGPLIPGFTVYTVTHPLTSSFAPPIPAGQYTPVLQSIVIEGVTYTSTGAEGTTQANLDCLSNINITVLPYSCNNCTEVGNYKCRKTYTTTPGSQVLPGSLSTTFELDPTQPYFAYSIKGDTVSDTLKITFINQDGTNYSDPIVVEYLEIGQSVNGGTDYGVSTNPKRIATNNSNSYYSKPINLTNFIINNGDYLILELIPNSNITQTSWDLYFTCLESFSCDSCLEINPLFKIDETTITSSLISPCDILSFSANIIGCPQSGLTNEDIFKYMHSLSNPFLDTSFYTQTPQSLYQGLNGGTMSANVSFNQGCDLTGFIGDVVCQTTIGQTINVVKVGSVITITCSSITDRNAFYNSYQTQFNLLNGWTPTPPSPTNFDYYQYISFKNIEPLSVNSTCGDGQYNTFVYDIHPSSTVTPSGGPGAYILTINLATITNQYPQNTCDDCYFLAEDITSTINSTINSPNINQTSNIALRYDEPFNGRYSMYINSATPLSYLGISALSIPYYSTRTLPYSGSPLTFIPSLSSTTCNFSWMTFENQIAPNGDESQYFNHIFYQYFIVLTDITNPTYYELRYLNPTGTLVYEVNSLYPSGHVVDPNYFL